MDVKLGQVVKVRNGYTCKIGCQIYDAGKVIEVTEGNIDELIRQKIKFELHVNAPVTEEPKITDEIPKRGRPKKTEDKMVRHVRSK